MRHRASFGISVEKASWGLGIGRALTQACIECARAAGYSQLELDVVSANETAVSLYKSTGFVEYGRNPKGFRTRSGQWQELDAVGAFAIKRACCIGVQHALLVKSDP